MSKEKQSGDCKNRNDHVNEMAKTIYSFLRSDTMSRAMASLLYGEGYRKQGEPISCTHENGGEWISVEDRLPEENGRYLAFVDISHLAFENLTTIAIMSYGKNHGFYLYNETEKVTHWMPLPEPPKMKGGAE